MQVPNLKDDNAWDAGYFSGLHDMWLFMKQYHPDELDEFCQTTGISPGLRERLDNLEEVQKMTFFGQEAL